MPIEAKLASHYNSQIASKKPPIPSISNRELDEEDVSAISVQTSIQLIFIIQWRACLPVRFKEENFNTESWGKISRDVLQKTVGGQWCTFKGRNIPVRSSDWRDCWLILRNSELTLVIKLPIYKVVMNLIWIYRVRCFNNFVVKQFSELKDLSSFSQFITLYSVLENYSRSYGSNPPSSTIWNEL